MHYAAFSPAFILYPMYSRYTYIILVERGICIQGTFVDYYDCTVLTHMVFSWPVCGCACASSSRLH